MKNQQLRKEQKTPLQQNGEQQNGDAQSLAWYNPSRIWKKNTDASSSQQKNGKVAFQSGGSSEETSVCNNGNSFGKNYGSF